MMTYTGTTCARKETASQQGALSFSCTTAGACNGDDILTIRRHSLQQDDTSAKIFNHRLLDARCHQLLEAHGSRVPRLTPWQCKKQQIGASRKECHLRCKRTSYLVSVTLDDSVKSTDDPFSPRM